MNNIDVCVGCGCEISENSSTLTSICNSCDRQGWWVDPAGGVHSPSKDDDWGDPAAMYEAKTPIKAKTLADYKKDLVWVKRSEPRYFGPEYDNWKKKYNSLQKKIEKLSGYKRTDFDKFVDGDVHSVPGYYEEAETPSAESEAKEHDKTYKKLKKDAKDGKLDTSELEFGKNIKQDHLSEVKKILLVLEKSVLREQYVNVGSDGEGNIISNCTVCGTVGCLNYECNCKKNLKENSAPQSNEYRKMMAHLDAAAQLAYVVGRQEGIEGAWNGTENLDITEKIKKLWMNMFKEEIEINVN